MLKRPLSFILLAAWCQATLAVDPFYATVVVGENTGAVGFATAEDAFNSLRTHNLNSIVPYAGFEVVSANINFRGLALQTGYPIESSPRLDLHIPALGISETFIGHTRSDSLKMLKEYFKNSDKLSDIMKELASKTPVDPIAGNPNSLQSRMVSNIYNHSFLSLVRRHSEEFFTEEQTASKTSLFLLAAIGDNAPPIDTSSLDTAKVPATSAGLQVARYRQSDLTTIGVTIPLSYSFGAEPERPFSLNGELHYTNTEAADSYSFSIGTAYNFEANEGWYLIPAISYGLTTSEDLGSTGQMISISLTSAALIYESDHSTLWLGNTVNHLRTLKTSNGDYSFDSKLRNVAFTNGLILSRSLSALGPNFWIEYSIADTRYTGSDLYDEHYSEIGISIARSRSSSSYFRGGLSYINTTHSRGWVLSLHSAF
ncbi:hypothetical protein ACE0DR_08560 [Azotobacter sp. CWF10]